MAKYTISVDSLIRQGYQVFDDSWDTYVEEHKAELCDKILKHYRFYEIGAETPARFKHYINTHLREIMPYYNMLYKTALEDLLPLYNYYTETSVEGKEHLKQNGLTSGRVDRKQLQYMANSLKTMVNTDATTDSTQDTTSHKNWTEDDTRNLTEKETTDTTYNETWKEKEDIKKDTTKQETGTEDETTDETYTRDTTSTKDQDTTGTSSGTKTQWSSDTPQGQINDGQIGIDAQYLTRYDHASESASSKGTLDETITAKEDFTDKKVRDLDTTDNTTQNEVTDRTASGEKDSTTNVDRNLTANETINKVGTDDFKENVVGNVHGITDEVGKKFEDGTVDTIGSDTTASATEHDTTKNNEVKTIVKGNINVTRAELIRKYRDTYLNIDLLVIEALANNFMGVF